MTDVLAPLFNYPFDARDKSGGADQGVVRVNVAVAGADSERKQQTHELDKLM